MKTRNQPTPEAREGLMVVAAIFLVGAVGLVIGLVTAGRIFEAGLGVLMVLFAAAALVQQLAARRG